MTGFIIYLAGMCRDTHTTCTCTYQQGYIQHTYQQGYTHNIHISRGTHTTYISAGVHTQHTYQQGYTHNIHISRGTHTAYISAGEQLMLSICRCRGDPIKTTIITRKFPCPLHAHKQYIESTSTGFLWSRTKRVCYCVQTLPRGMAM